MTNNTILVLFAIVNVAVTALFAGMVLRQYIRRRRIYQLFWVIGLSMAFLATLAYILMVLAGPATDAGELLFRAYYIFGAALVPAWLGLGSIALIASKRISYASLVILCVLSLLAAITIAIASVNADKLRAVAGTPGTGVLAPGAWLPLIIVLNTLGVLAVVGVAAYSGWKLFQRQAGKREAREDGVAQREQVTQPPISLAGFHPGNLFWANVLILTGDLLNATAGTLARAFGLNSSFWLIMALGWIVFFLGVLFTSRRPTTERPMRRPVEVKAT